MTIGPNEDGAELYREHLESIPCPTCGAKESDFKALSDKLEKSNEENRKLWLILGSIERIARGEG